MAEPIQSTITPRLSRSNDTRCLAPDRLETGVGVAESTELAAGCDRAGDRPAAADPCMTLSARHYANRGIRSGYQRQPILMCIPMPDPPGDNAVLAGPPAGGQPHPRAGEDKVAK